VTIIDIVDVTRDHSLTTLPSLFGFSEKFDLPILIKKATVRKASFNLHPRLPDFNF
jgi:hypothetical protein